MYTPPFVITAKAIDLISRISERIGKINALGTSPRQVALRKENRIKTIHSSLAIENNSLSIEQITAIIEGKRVFGAPNEIQEVKNAVQAYGNGRMGRLWQTVILKDWKEVFAWLPVETLIKENQAEYYAALNTSDTNADSTAFIDFMLDLILKTIEKIIKNENRVTAKVTVKVTANQQKILGAIKENPHVTQNELAQIVGIERKNIITNMKKLQEAGLLKRVGADKNSWWEVLQ